MKFFTSLCLALVSIALSAQQLQLVEQDFDTALALAKSSDKLLFIDFYTTWCGPCKKLDKEVFRNERLKPLLGRDVILLRYDAENDSTFHLSKKYHVANYPSAIILDDKGRLVTRAGGFNGESADSLAQSVLSYIAESVEAYASGQFVKGYSASVDPDLYPRFYADFVDRTIKYPDSTVINTYLLSSVDPLSEQFFSILIYFGSDANDTVADKVVTAREAYTELYGDDQVFTLFYFLSAGKFNRAIDGHDEKLYSEAVKFATTNMTRESAADIISSYEFEYLKSQGRWKEFIQLHNEAKSKGERSAGYLNHISYGIYEDCDDEFVLATCIDWMREVVAAAPEFDYLDTYAFLLHKVGDKSQAKLVALRAIEVGKAADRNTADLEKLVAKL